MRGSKVFKPMGLPESNSSGYPAPFRDGQRKRWNRRLGDYGGLKNYGVNFVRVEPGGQSSARHAHTKQDEFVYIVSGSPTLLLCDREFHLRAGDCCGFKAGSGVGHQLVNRSNAPVLYLEIGDRTPDDYATYPRDDLAFTQRGDGSWELTHKDGTSY